MASTRNLPRPRVIKQKPRKLSWRPKLAVQPALLAGPPTWNGTYLTGGATDDFPALHLTWNDAIAFPLALPGRVEDHTKGRWASGWH